MKIENEILNILDTCNIERNILFLPPTQLDRKTYQIINKVIESIGGKWDRRTKGHIFCQDPKDLIENLILTAEITDIKKEFQYFPTPRVIAQLLVDMAEIKQTDRLLEPSAGQGAIADLFPKENAYVLIELNQKKWRNT